MKLIINGREANNQKRRHPRMPRATKYVWNVLEHGLREFRASVTERHTRNLMQFLKEQGKRIGYPRSDREEEKCTPIYPLA